MLDYKKYINEVLDFPKRGISFKDISPLLADKKVFKQVINEMGNLVANTWLDVPDYWIGIDSRGFLFAGALSYAFGGGVVMCRKSGKLPPTVVHLEYDLEYGQDSLEIKPGKGKVVIVDDVLATGGTLQTVNQLCETAGYDIIDNLVLIDLLYIPRTSFNLEVKSLIQYE
jgi:adenine phosphoribosyltransferase|tara:strand:- start:311 stop:820 length:510 start_codon:yes stop_codon:yes gene_type:complete